MMQKSQTQSFSVKKQAKEERRIIASSQQVAVLGLSAVNNEMGSTLNCTYFTLSVSSVILLGD